MNAVELTKFLVENIVKEPDMVSVKEFEDEITDNIITLEKTKKDFESKLIGKNKEKIELHWSPEQISNYPSNIKVIYRRCNNA